MAGSGAAMGPRIVFTADTKQAVAAVTQLQLHTESTIGGITRVSDIAATALKALGLSFVAVGAAAMVTYGAVSSFNQSLTHVRALGNLTQQEMNELANSVNRVSVAYGVSGDVIADGTVVLAKAGLTVDQINDSIAAMTALSKANSISFEEAANMTVFAVETFHKEYSDVTDLLDKMQVAAQQSILDIGDLQKAFAYAGSTAMMTGVSYEELLAIMATLSNRALEAGISARSTNKMLLDIVQHADKLQAFYEGMGKNFDIIQDGTINFTELVNALSDATINVEFLQGATDIFTVRALRAFGLLAGASEDYNSMLTNINGAQGELNRTVDVQMTAFAARLDILKQEMVAMLRSPEVMAAMDMMVGGMEELARDIIPEFTAALTQASQAFAGMMANPQIQDFMGNVVRLFSNLFKVSVNLVNVLMAFDGRLIKLLGSIVAFRYLVGGFITQMMTLSRAWDANYNAIQRVVIMQSLLEAQMAMSSANWVMLKRSLHDATQAFGDLKIRVDGAYTTFEKAAFAINYMDTSIKKGFLYTMQQAQVVLERFKVAMQPFIQVLSHLSQKLSEIDLKQQLFNLKIQQGTIILQMYGAALGNAVSMGLMFATLDFSPLVQALIVVSMLVNQIAFGMTLWSIFSATKATADIAGPLAIATMLAMAAASIGVWASVKDTYKAADLGPQYSALQEQYETADTGMFVRGGRSVYDEGGVAPRHQLIYVEPGEQIISKTQGMVGMGSGVNVYVGDVYTQDGTDFADKLADALPRAMQRASYRGTF